MALVHERMAPCHQPNTAALAKVMRNAGMGAATLWSTMSANDTATAQGPKERISSATAAVSPLESRAKTEFTPSRTAGTLT